MSATKTNPEEKVTLKFTEMDSLPEITISAEVPPVANGLLVSPTTNQGEYAEFGYVRGILATIAGYKGNWCLVDADDFDKLCKQGPWRFCTYKGFRLTLMEMQEENYLTVIKVNEKFFIQPHQLLADKLHQYGYTYAPRN